MTDHNDRLINWTGDVERSAAMEQYAQSQDAFDGVARAYHRDFLDIEPNRSAKPHFGAHDYYAFKPEEQVPKKAKRS